MDTGDWIQAGAAVVAAMSLVWVVWQFRREWRRLEDARQESAFDTVNSHYFDFLALCMQHPELDLADLSDTAGPHLPSTEDPRAFSVRNQVLYEYFFQLLEKVFVLYRVGNTWERDIPGANQPKASGAPTGTGGKRTAQAPGATRGSKFELGDFRRRQWNGWDFWIFDYCKRPSIRQHFATLDNDKTYDSEFMEYMKHRMKQAEGHI